MHKVITTASAAECEEWVGRLRASARSQGGGGDAVREERKAVLVIVNPHGGAGTALKLWEDRMEPLLRFAGQAYDLVKTAHAREAVELGRAYNPLVYEGVCCFSGDGLVQEVVSGLLSRRDWRSLVRRVPLCSVACGTQNVLAVGLRTSQPEAAAVALIKRHLRPLDGLLISNGRGLRTVALCGVGWGIPAEIAARSESVRFLGTARYAWLKLQAGCQSLTGGNQQGAHIEYSSDVAMDNVGIASYFAKLRDVHGVEADDATVAVLTVDPEDLRGFVPPGRATETAIASAAELSARHGPTKRGGGRVMGRDSLLAAPREEAFRVGGSIPAAVESDAPLVGPSSPMPRQATAEETGEATQRPRLSPSFVSAPNSVRTDMTASKIDPTNSAPQSMWTVPRIGGRSILPRLSGGEGITHAEVEPPLTGTTPGGPISTALSFVHTPQGPATSSAHARMATLTLQCSLERVKCGPNCARCKVLGHLRYVGHARESYVIADHGPAAATPLPPSGLALPSRRPTTGSGTTLPYSTRARSGTAPAGFAHLPPLPLPDAGTVPTRAGSDSPSSWDAPQTRAARASKVVSQTPMRTIRSYKYGGMWEMEPAAAAAAPSSLSKWIHSRSAILPRAAETEDPHVWQQVHLGGQEGAQEGADSDAESSGAGVAVTLRETTTAGPPPPVLAAPLGLPVHAGFTSRGFPRTAISGRFVTIAAINCGPDACFSHPSDGFLDLVVCQRGSLWGTAGLLLRYVLSALSCGYVTVSASPLYRYEKCRSVILTPWAEPGVDGEDVGINVDGEHFPGPGPFRVHLFPSLLTAYGFV